jgi:hypothetical protein
MANVVRPQSRVATSPTATPQQIMQDHAQRIMKVMGWLEEFADGRLHLSQLPDAWKYELPRLLRPYLTPGRGAACTIKFDPADAKPCDSDPAMKNRPPALGLAHELIHALHGVRGTNLVGVEDPSGQTPEEIITTGLPPYQFEEYSDNKLRALWSTPQLLRMQY